MQPLHSHSLRLSGVCLERSTKDLFLQLLTKALFSRASVTTVLRHQYEKPTCTIWLLPGLTNAFFFHTFWICREREECTQFLWSSRATRAYVGPRHASEPCPYTRQEEEPGGSVTLQYGKPTPLSAVRQLPQFREGNTDTVLGGKRAWSAFKEQPICKARSASTRSTSPYWSGCLLAGSPPLLREEVRRGSRGDGMERRGTHLRHGVRVLDRPLTGHETSRGCAWRYTIGSVAIYSIGLR